MLFDAERMGDRFEELLRDSSENGGLVEILGQEMLASIDGDKIGFGANELIGTEKANFGLVVSGQTASFKNLRVWEALPNKNWSETKAKLASAAPAK